MTTEFKDFYYTLKENLESYNGEYASFIDCGPNLFKLLCDVLDEEAIDRETRNEICSAIAYYVVPMDIIPEQIYGPYGYIDDIYITVYVLRNVAEKYGYDLLQEVWDFPNNVKEVMDDCYEKSFEVLEEDQIESILAYVGLTE